MSVEYSYLIENTRCRVNMQYVLVHCDARFNPDDNFTYIQIYVN